MRRKVSSILLFLIIAAGIGLLLYPTVSDYWNSYHQSAAIADYSQKVEKLEGTELEEMWEEAKAYNRALAKKEDRYHMSEAEEEEYDQTLDVTGTGIMGYIEIPELEIRFPIYHKADEGILQVAVGHLPGSSLPVGGNGTHSVLVGHSGLPSAKLFTSLDTLKEGDIFILTVLKETLTYQVDQIKTVLPGEMEDLELCEEEDLCTLVTCTPYGVNSHRLLVRGHRIANIIEEPKEKPKEGKKDFPMFAAIAAAAAAVLLLLIVFLALRKRRKKRRRHRKR